MQEYVIRYRYEAAFFLENPPRGRFEIVLFKIAERERIDADGRYPSNTGPGSSGAIFFGLDDQANRMVYFQFPPGSSQPSGMFVRVAGATVYKNWLQYPQTGSGVDCIE